MALIACSECSKEISDKAATCPHCGAPVASGQSKRGSYYDDTPASHPPVATIATKSNWWKWVIGVPVFGFVLLMVIGSCTDSPERQQRFREADAIKLCWEEQKRKSLDPGTARFVAGACEKMERDFEQRHGRRP